MIFGGFLHQRSPLFNKGCILLSAFFVSRILKKCQACVVRRYTHNNRKVSRKSRYSSDTNPFKALVCILMGLAGSNSRGANGGVLITRQRESGYGLINQTAKSHAIYSSTLYNSINIQTTPTLPNYIGYRKKP